MGRLDFIERHYKQMSDRDMADYLGVETAFVRAVRKHHGLHGGVKKPDRRGWEPHEDKILKERYRDTPWPELLKALPGRSHEAIRRRANIKGYVRSKDMILYSRLNGAP